MYVCRCKKYVVSLQRINQYYIVMKKTLLISAIALLLFSCEERNPVSYPSSSGGNNRNTTTTDVTPTAGFNSKKESEPFKFTFTSTCQNAKSVVWDFGDGNTSKETNPTHTYSSSGNYTVTLTAYNQDDIYGFNVKSDRATKVLSFSDPTDPYVTGIRYNTVATYGMYYYTQLDDDGPWLVYTKFKTNYTLVDHARVEYKFTEPVLLNNMEKHDYYTLYVYNSTNSSKKGTQILKQQIYKSTLKKFKTELSVSNSDRNTEVILFLKWTW